MGEPDHDEQDALGIGCDIPTDKVFMDALGRYAEHAGEVGLGAPPPQMGPHAEDQRVPEWGVRSRPKRRTLPRSAAWGRAARGGSHQPNCQVGQASGQNEILMDHRMDGIAHGRRAGFRAIREWMHRLKRETPAQSFIDQVRIVSWWMLWLPLDRQRVFT